MKTMLFVAFLVGISTAALAASAENCHVEKIIYRSADKVQFSQAADSNVGFGPGQDLPVEHVSIELIFNVPMRFETFHPYSVYIRQVTTGNLLNNEYTKGDLRDPQDNPRSVIIIVQDPLDPGSHYELIVQGWDLVPSANATVANAAKPLPDAAMKHSLQWVFETVAEAAEKTDAENKTFYIP